MLMADSANTAGRLSRYFCRSKNENEMIMRHSFGKKLLAVILGISIVVLIVVHVVQDDLLIVGINK